MSLHDRIAAAKARRVQALQARWATAGLATEAPETVELKLGTCGCGAQVRWSVHGHALQVDALRGETRKTDSAGAKVVLHTRDGCAVRCTLDPEGTVEGWELHRCVEAK